MSHRLDSPLTHSPLGKPSPTPQQYDPSLLFPLPRAPQRQALGINAPLPFSGADLWNAYELAWLNPQGKPVVAIASFAIDCASPNIIESKSLKLYLNSLHNQVFADIGAVLRVLEKDLGAACNGAVTVALTPAEGFGEVRLGRLEGSNLDRLDVVCSEYQPAPANLTLVKGGGSVSETLTSDLLKSNCPVTGQPDWGSVQIAYRGAAIDHAGLLRYLVSFRNHQEFHEHCVERIFVDIWQRCQPLELFVYARYTRRGGLDINPWRSSRVGFVAPENLRLARQ